MRKSAQALPEAMRGVVLTGHGGIEVQAQEGPSEGSATRRA